MRNFINYFLDRSLFVNLLSIILLLVGFWIIYNMNKSAFPNVNFDIITIRTIWPGASTDDIEKLVTNPLEESLKAVDGIKEYRSSSIENQSVITITLDPDLDDTQDVIDSIRSNINRTEDLPDNSKTPIITEISTKRTPVIEWSIVPISTTAKSDKSKTVSKLPSYKKLRKVTEVLEKKLLKIKGVARVNRRGWRDAEIFIDLQPNLLNRYLIGSNSIIQALRGRNINLPGGDILIDQKEVIVRTVAEFKNVEEIKRVPIVSNEIGASTNIGDIAHVYEDFSELDILDMTGNNPSIALTVIKRENADIIEIVNESKAIVKEYNASLIKEGIKINSTNDLSYFVKRRLQVLLSNGLIGIALVVIILFLFLGGRTALMVAVGIPVSFCIAFIAMAYTGVNLNLISMFGLIVALGIIVDDSIVVSENFYYKLERGASPLEAASAGPSEVFAPVLATIATSVAAFSPLLFMSGIMGKFVFSIPYVVILCLLASLFECFIILPAHLRDINKNYHIISKRKKQKENYLSKLIRYYYRPFLNFSLKNRTLCLLAFVFLLIIAFMIQIAFGSFKLFPGGTNAIIIKLETATGTPNKEMMRYLKVLGNYVSQIPKSDLESYIGRAGVQQQDTNDPFTKRGSHYGMLMIYLKPEVDRKYDALTIMTWLKQKTRWLVNPANLLAVASLDPRLKAKIKTFENNLKRDIRDKDINITNIEKKYKVLRGGLLNLRLGERKGGPPVGKPISIEILGNDIGILKNIVKEYKMILEKIPGIKDIEDSQLPKRDEIRVKVNEKVAAQTGLSILEVANAINTSFEGNIATSIRRPNEEVDIRVRNTKEYRKSLSSLNKVSITNRQGNLIPIARLSSFERQKSIAAINHLNGERLITVSARPNEKEMPLSAALKMIKELSKDIPGKYPRYTIQFGGEYRDTEESLATLGNSFLIALLIIFMILASLFRSMLQPFVILSAIPFAFIGVIFTFLLHGEPFSFLSLMGVIGLTGVVVNDSIILVDYANKLKIQKPNLSNIDLARQAGIRRVRAVLLTTLTTAGGLLPTAYGFGGYDTFLVPMALAFAWGLVFSTVLILILVPILYSLVLDFNDWRENKNIAANFASKVANYSFKRNYN